MGLGRSLRVPRALLRRCGFDVVRYSQSLATANARRVTAIRAHRIDIALDIGASEGDFARRLRESGYTGRIISFEPLSASYQRLLRISAGDRMWDAVHTAIGEQDGETSINISGRRTSSSLLPMASSHVAAAPESRYVSVERVRISRLDSLLGELFPGNSRLYVKMDVQGYEGRVLDGAREALERTRIVELEVSTIPLYEGSVLLAEILGVLYGLGFRLISWEDVLTDPQKGYVLQADCILVRPE